MNLKHFFNTRVLKPLADGLKPPRRFEEDWSDQNDKEKIWIKYKFFLMLKNQGDTEINVFETMFYSLIIGMTIIDYWNNSDYLIGLGITLPIWLIALWPFILAFSWWYKYKIGDYKDKKDLIALEAEIINRRDKVSREIRKFMKVNK